MNYENNFYYSPEKSHLEVIKSFDTGGGYEFDMFVIWKHKDNRLFYAEDSGCSCPTPFQVFNSFEDLNEINKQSFSSFEADFKNYCKRARDYETSDGVSLGEEIDTINKISKLIKN